MKTQDKPFNLLYRAEKQDCLTELDGWLQPSEEELNTFVQKLRNHPRRGRFGAVAFTLPHCRKLPKQAFFESALTSAKIQSVQTVNGSHLGHR
jgi:hypothetical protein